jgi:hypothetical protein
MELTLPVTEKQAAAWNDFRSIALLRERTPEDLLNEVVAGYVRDNGGDIKEKTLVTWKELSVKMRSELGREPRRFWLHWMRANKWEEGLHYFKRSERKYFYDLDMVWPDCVAYALRKERTDAKAPGRQPVTEGGFTALVYKEPNYEVE